MNYTCSTDINKLFDDNIKGSLTINKCPVCGNIPEIEVKYGQVQVKCKCGHKGEIYSNESIDPNNNFVTQHYINTAIYDWNRNNSVKY